jgi:hypothetical protein
MFLLFGIVPFAAAQDLTETFVSADETYTVAYPEDFEVNEEDAITTIVGRLGRESIIISIASPEIVTQLVAETAGRRLDTKLENILTDLGYEITESDVVEFGDSELAYALIAPTADDLQGAGYLKPLSDGESFGLMIALNDRDEFSEDAQSIIGGMLSTYDLYDPRGSSGGGSEQGGGELPASLRDFDGRAEDALAELQDAGIVEDGEIIAEERSIELQGDEVQTLDVGPGDDVANFVMAFEINFASENAREYETCSMVARYMTDRNDNAQFLEIGVNNDDEALVFDLFGPNDGESTYVAVAEGIDLADPQHFLVLVSGSQAVVYLNGELVADNVEVADHEGIFFLLLRGKDRDTVCEARNVWIFQADGELNLGDGGSSDNSGGGGGGGSGDCIVVADSNVNQRSGPGTTFDRAGFLNKGEEAVAIAVAEDRDGALWFQLEDETWVRADVVTAQGDCDSLPEGG